MISRDRAASTIPTGETSGRSPVAAEALPDLEPVAAVVTSRQSMELPLSCRRARGVLGGRVDDVRALGIVVDGVGVLVQLASHQGDRERLHT